jgi:hypothetical protein
MSFVAWTLQPTGTVACAGILKMRWEGGLCGWLTYKGYKGLLGGLLTQTNGRGKPCKKVSFLFTCPTGKSTMSTDLSLQVYIVG